MHKEGEAELTMYCAIVGLRVEKRSGKPFKSKLKVNTTNGLCVHPTQKTWCYTFKEDDSYVEAGRCMVVVDDSDAMCTQHDRLVAMQKLRTMGGC